MYRKLYNISISMTTYHFFTMKHSKSFLADAEYAVSYDAQSPYCAAHKRMSFSCHSLYVEPFFCSSHNLLPFQQAQPLLCNTLCPATMRQTF